MGKNEEYVERRVIGKLVLKELVRFHITYIDEDEKWIEVTADWTRIVGVGSTVDEALIDFSEDLKSMRDYLNELKDDELTESKLNEKKKINDLIKFENMGYIYKKITKEEILYKILDELSENKTKKILNNMGINRMYNTYYNEEYTYKQILKEIVSTGKIWLIEENLNYRNESR